MFEMRVGVCLSRRSESVYAEEERERREREDEQLVSKY